MITIATPSIDSKVHISYMKSLFGTFFNLSKEGIPFNYLTLENESLVSRARNSLVAHFLAGPGDYFMFIDSDIGFDPNDILKLKNADKDIICGLYRLKGQELRYPCNFLKDKFMDKNGIIEVENGPTGFMMVKRKVFEEMIKAYPELKYNDNSSANNEYTKDYFYMLFSEMIDEQKRHHSEDYGFCYRWRKLGGKIFIDTTIRLTHSGNFVYTDTEEDLKQFINLSFWK